MDPKQKTLALNPYYIIIAVFPFFFSSPFINTAESHLARVFTRREVRLMRLLRLVRLLRILQQLWLLLSSMIASMRVLFWAIAMLAAICCLTWEINPRRIPQSFLKKDDNPPETSCFPKTFGVSTQFIKVFYFVFQPIMNGIR